MHLFPPPLYASSLSFPSKSTRLHRKPCSLLQLSLLALVWNLFFFLPWNLFLPIFPVMSHCSYSPLSRCLSLSSSTRRSLYLHLCLCEPPLSSSHPSTSLSPSVSVPQPLCLFTYTWIYAFIPLLLHLPASHIITFPFSSSRTLFLSVFPVFLNRVIGLRPHVSRSLSLIYFCCHFLVALFSFSCHHFLNLPIPPYSTCLPIFLYLFFQRWAEVVIVCSTISMQSHGAVALPSLIELAAKYRHCWGSASLERGMDERMEG